MKGFIEVSETKGGTVLINVSSIICIKPLLGLNIGTNGAYSVLMINNGDNKVQEMRLVETYDQVKALLDSSL